MRENIGLFRGLDPHFERFKWVYGGLVVMMDPSGGEDMYMIIDECDTRTQVVVDSVGECTGMTDGDGRLIFENDILAVKDAFGRQVLYVAFEEGEFVLKNKSYELYRASLRMVCLGPTYKCSVIGFILNGTELYECQYENEVKGRKG